MRIGASEGGGGQCINTQQLRFGFTRNGSVHLTTQGDSQCHGAARFAQISVNMCVLPDAWSSLNSGLSKPPGNMRNKVTRNHRRRSRTKKVHTRRIEHVTSPVTPYRAKKRTKKQKSWRKARRQEPK